MNYYLVSTFSSLGLDEPLPWGPSDFLGACEGWLGPEELAAVRALVGGGEAGSTHPWVRRWWAREAQLRNAVGRCRAARAGREDGRGARAHEGFDVSLERGVVEAMGQPDPLARERALDRVRWGLAEELGREGGAFGFGAVAGYAVCLRLAARWAGMRVEVGEAVFAGLVEEVTRESLDGVDWGGRGAG